MKALAAALLNPATRTGTAWWAALAVTLYDAARQGVTVSNGVVLLTLAGLDIAARYLAGSTGPTPPPPAVPADQPASVTP